MAFLRAILELSGLPPASAHRRHLFVEGSG